MDFLKTGCYAVENGGAFERNFCTGEWNMLEAYAGKKREIKKVFRKGGALFLEAEAGTIRLIPQTETIVRVSYTEKETFSGEQGNHIIDLTAEMTENGNSVSDWDYTEGEQEIVLRTEKLQVIVNRKTGSVCFRKTDGTLLLQEAERESKITEEFDVYRTVVNEHTRIEEVRTPDGIKRRIRESEREFAGKRFHTKLQLVFQEKESLFGLGQAEEGVWNLRHTTQYLHQANLKIALPALLSNLGWGILLSTQSPAIFQDTQYGSYLYTEADEYIDYYFLAGETLGETVKGIRKLTGKAALLPKWAYGYIQSQERYETAEELLKTAEEFRRREIGLDALVLDWMSWEGNLWGQKTFDKTRFPNPQEMIEKLHEKNVHFMISIWPNMNENCDNYREFQERNLLLPASEIYDAFSEEGRKLYWEQAQRGLFCHGVDAWWCDSSEPLTPEWSRLYKPDPAEMYRDFVDAAEKCMPIEKANAYGLYHAQALCEGQRGTTEEKRVVNLTRNGYLGSQKYGTILWSGDTYASWETLRRQIVAGLQFCISGLPYWTLDIGAFFVKPGISWFWKGEYEGGNTDPAYRELYVRWLQYGAFLPIFRSHGTDCRREPWNFGEKGEPFYEAILSAIRLRYQLLPYIYSVAGAVWLEDETMMRALVMDFPEDSRAAEIADEYLFGPSLLICPVTTPMYYQTGGVPIENMQYTRQVYLPAGTDWYDLYTKEKYEGGQEITAKADIERIPVYVRAGAVLPIAKPENCAADTQGKEICLQVYAGCDGSFTLYEDAGDGYGYEKGEYCLTRIQYCQESGKVTWTVEGDQRFRKGALSVEVIGKK